MMGYMGWASRGLGFVFLDGKRFTKGFQISSKIKVAALQSGCNTFSEGRL